MRSEDRGSGRAGAGSDDRVARAAFWLAAAFFLTAVPWPEPPPRPLCSAPAQAAARDGHTTAVRCDGRGAPLAGPARLLFGQRLDPNRADAEALEVLPGVGPVRAAAIVAERERRPFARVEDLRRVRGIGPVTLRRIAPFLGVEEGGASLPQNR